ncbi:MAG: hypothetical protein JKX85_02520 [Phycisphaeraceae bacterium]|nr:hypothetical protein [Phycisphaeraceae bacterium]
MAKRSAEHAMFLPAKGQSKYKLKIHKWVALSRANVFSVMVAQQAVVHTEIMYELMQLIRSQEMDHYLPGVVFDKTWLNLYQDHRAVTKAVAFVYELDGIWPYKTSDVQKELGDSRMVSNWTKNQPEQFAALIKEEFSPVQLMKFVRLGIRLNHRNYKLQLKQFAKIAQGDMGKADDESFDERLKSSPGLHFYLRVALPCMCVYQKFPLTVFRMAKRECLQKNSMQNYVWLENLIRLDPYMAGADFVRDWVNIPGGLTTIERRKKIAEWSIDGLDTGQKLTRRKVKYWFGGYIWAVAQRFGKVLIPKPVEYGPEGPMTAGEILELFDAWAQDASPLRGKECLHLRDEDLADLQEKSWRSAIRPYRNQWDHILSGGGGWNSG